MLSHDAGLSEREPRPLKVVFAIPTITRPYQQCLDALEASVPALDAAGIDHSVVFHIGCPYISYARNFMLRQAMDAKADVVVFIDHDLSWRPEDLVKLIQTEGDVVAGLYRFKKAEEVYMGVLLNDDEKKPVLRSDWAIRGEWVPAGFLKVTKRAVHRFMGAYPELIYGARYNPYIDLFNHGAMGGLWYGEDYAFSKRWIDCGGEIWIVPDLELTHHAADGTAYPGNYHEFMLRQPGGSNAPRSHEAEADLLAAE